MKKYVLNPLIFVLTGPLFIIGFAYGLFENAFKAGCQTALDYDPK